MNLQTYGKIGIIAAVVMFGILTANFTIMILNHEFGFRFHDSQDLSETQKQKLIDGFYELPEYKAFKDRYQDSQVNIYDQGNRVELSVSQYEPSTQNGLVLRIEQSDVRYSADIQVTCDVPNRSNGIRTHANDGLAYDFIKTTPCVNPSK